MPEVRGSIGQTPPNILILPDGNRRWAKEKGVPYSVAYELGARRIAEITHQLGEFGMRQVWFGVARPFNFMRAKEDIIPVLEACLKIQAIGREDNRPFNISAAGSLAHTGPEYYDALKSQERDRDPDGVTAHLLIGWSSDTDLAAFVIRSQEYPSDTVQENLHKSSGISEKIGYVIRTGVSGQGGRLSGMVPPHSLDAELHFERTLFPDFTTNHLDAALLDYQSRTHRDRISL